VRRLGLLLLLLALWSAPVWAQGQFFNSNLTVAGTINAGTATGSGNAYVLTLNPPIAAYVTNQCFMFQANHTVTGAATLNINARGVKALRKFVSTVSTDLSANDIANGQIITVCYDGTNMQLTGGGPGGGGGGPGPGGVPAFVTSATALSAHTNAGGL
jgi:hypothetical protein